MVKFLKSLERGVKKCIPAGARKYLRSSKFELITTRARPIELIVHVGAHFAEDRIFYESLGAETVLWIEADPDTFLQLEQILSAHPGSVRHIAHLGLVSEEAGHEMSFHRYNGDGSSSSVYHPTDYYKERFQNSHATGEVLTLSSQTLPSILEQYEIDLASVSKAMLVVDVQGHELAVLRGLGDHLRNFAFCKCEVSRLAIYDKGASFTEVDNHFRAHGFKLASHRYARVPKHGDVLYVGAGRK